MGRPLTKADRARRRTLGRGDLTGVKVWAYHGVFDHERRDGQVFLVDVSWWQDFTAPANADELGLTTNYAELADHVVELMTAEPVDLIETVAVKLCEGLLARFPMEYVQVTVHKPDAPLTVEFSDVSVRVGAARDGSTPRAPQVPPSEHVAVTRDGSAATRQVVFSIGSNIEPRWQYLQFAVTALATTPGLTDVAVSPVYSTAPVGVTGHPDYLNAVVIGRSILPARELLQRGLDIERIAHRRRVTPDEHPPRTLDIDLIAVGDETWSDETLTLPHPRAAQRAFVLRPWLDLDPTARLVGRPLADWLGTIPDQGICQESATLFLP